MTQREIDPAAAIIRATPIDFLLKRWEVTVGRYGTGTYLAPTRGAAMADAWRSDAFSGYTFGEFLKIARCRRDRYTPARWGGPITVLGKPAYFVGENGQYVIFAYPGGKFTLHAHPYDVEPESYRPRAYRTAAA